MFFGVEILGNFSYFLFEFLSEKRYNVIGTAENQATLKGAFGFLAQLTGKRPAKSDIKREGAGLRAEDTKA